ncbi:hypothetical protein [Polyangium jinanense]|uniref:Uncharacterized protein n=1 Tax=Polyangium jinanense TaxID=2829994 RepID=A0A9X4AQA6_9BACT|nr:hypothetical protein [Polyangium jinanense]MDC3954585.1 hypothetical protein [Polyangium jinanense]MDC3980888.1 hypothetical protein [Polyangium jinanense]
MNPAERGLLSVLGGVATGVHVLVAIAVLVLGLVLVRPVNQNAGLIFAGAGGVRLFGLGLDLILDAMTVTPDAIMTMHAIGTVIWLGTGTVFFGGIAFGSYKLAETRQQKGGGAWAG